MNIIMNKLVNLLRDVRHGPLNIKALNPLWVKLGNYARKLARKCKLQHTQQYISTYGPFKLDHEFMFSNFKNWGKKQNKAFQQCVNLCQNANCVLDVGAHIGLFALPISKTILPNNGHVYCFEPAVKNRQHLLSHIHKNNITVIPQLVGEQHSQQVNFFQSSNCANGMNSIAIREKKSEIYEKILITQISLDEYCIAKNLHPDVIKIDVEGAEINVLKGARKIISRYKPKIIISTHPKELYLLGSSTELLLNLIKNMQYTLYDIEHTIVDKILFDEYLMLPNSNTCNN